MEEPTKLVTAPGEKVPQLIKDLERKCLETSRTPLIMPARGVQRSQTTPMSQYSHSPRHVQSPLRSPAPMHRALQSPTSQHSSAANADATTSLALTGDTHKDVQLQISSCEIPVNSVVKSVNSCCGLTGAEECTELKNAAMTKEQEKIFARDLTKMFAEHEDHRQKIVQLADALETLKDSSVSKELEPMIEKMLGWHDEHRACVKSVISRLESVEERIVQTENVLVEHSKVQELRSEFSKDLHAAKKILIDLKVSVNSCAKAESLTTGLKHVDHLEQLLGESVGNHANHKASMEKRLELIEKQLGDNAKMLGEHADNHSSHKTSVENRLEFFEKLIHENAGKHAKELAAHADKYAGQVAALETTLTGFAKSEHHATLLERVTYLEKCIGESANMHSNHKATMETRLEYIEKTIGDNAEKHAKDLAAHADKHARDLAAYAEKHGLTLSEHDKKFLEQRTKMSGLETAMNGFAKSEQHATMLQRMEYLEKMLGESADSHKNHKATLEMRMEFLEKMVGDNAEKHAKELAAHAAKNAENVDKHAKALAAHADKHAKDLAAHAEKHGMTHKKVS